MASDVTSPISDYDQYLASLLTESRLASIFKLGIPLPKSDPKAFPSDYDPQDPVQSVWKPLCWPPLLALSKKRGSSIPDFLTFLPPPSSTDFPECALGLLILLDQAPRIICNGMDERWRSAYFDPLALRFAYQLHALPESENLERQSRWLDPALNFAFPHYILARLLLRAPFAHAENMDAQNMVTQLNIEFRKEVETYYGVPDLYYDPELAGGNDTLAFSKIARAGFPKKKEGEEYDWKTHAFWYCWIIDAHPPIIRTFGHYPYRNRALGRETSEEEERWLVETERFGESVEESDAARIREDIEKGVWTGLGEG
ncbi:hypothetical protein BCR34DRAFT_573435 [Clohesyomyces aquaticus]|uniref:Uncharacterized protein n=1 Tax=Clohesyomyces aquaticus TaxID=1231657 RepID=A0A1Y1Z0B7_9PLEO|nr:hypothetical protein BCR34DRAFT_573435 [Clohesyomyces aquaticus]